MNLTYAETKHTCDRVLRQRLVLEEYGRDIKYIEGKKNLVADALSRLETNDYASKQYEANLMKHKYQDNVRVPVDMNIIAEEQGNDKELKTKKEKCPNRFKEVVLKNGKALNLYKADETKENWSIYVPTKLAMELLEWFHENLIHPGGSRLTETIRQKFYVKNLDEMVKKLVKTCKTCQEGKITALQPVGKVPMRTERSCRPFEIVRIDCCGPWEINVKCDNPKKMLQKKIHAATIIDDATAWPEIIQLEGKTAYHLALKFDSQWLCRYPRPRIVVNDNGGEFTGSEFQELLSSYAIEQQPTTVLNPRSNGIKERMHLTMADMLRTMTLKVKNDNESVWKVELEAALQAIAWAMRSTVSNGTKYSPANLTFGRDMILNEEVKINWDSIKANREKKAQIDNEKENKTRKTFQYKKGDKCWIIKNKFERKRKLDKPTEGPYFIKKVFNNGTLKIDRNGYDETINIRRLKPFTNDN